MNHRASIKESVTKVLQSVNRPARYVGGELNVIKKDPDKQNVSICLAFPDIYDIGQSYIGFHILYNILNKRPGTLCERAYAPWPDMEAHVREQEIPLWSLENFLPVSSFDVIGFTLQYEMHYTTVLNMLDLAGIPLMAADRTSEHPLIIGGGTCCVNPEPVTDFFDAFLLGDGEEGLPEIMGVVERCKKDGVSREETLLELAGVEGVYIPSLYRPVYGGDGEFTGMETLTDLAKNPLRSRIVEELKAEHYPERPLVPQCEVVHDRLAVEIMRGCARGCRFCGAGMSYRPHRIRPAADIVNQVVKGIRNSGWEEISLVSLSTTDYPDLEDVVKQIGTKLDGKSVSISLSSLRADNFSLKMAEATAGGRKTGLTFAIEAGTQRLRDVINKNLTEEQLFETIKSARDQGFGTIKLYFMVGLPTETEEDVLAIADMLNRIGGIVRNYKGKRINVTLSPFSPKPATPFQWEKQDSVATLSDKLKTIRRNLKSRIISIKESNPMMSSLECLLARGGREYGAVILDAWKLGSRLDGWSEHFREGLWIDAFSKHGIDPESYGGMLTPGQALPWGHLHFGVDESYLLAENDLAISGTTTRDCMEVCHNCGPYAALCGSMKKSVSADTAKSEADKTKEKQSMFGRKRKSVNIRPSLTAQPGTHLRIKYSKNETGRYAGHLDMIRLFDRAIRRAEIPIAYSQGFHPHPKLSFGYPLPLGFKSMAEYIDITLSKPFPAIESSLKQSLPEGIEIEDIKLIREKARSVASVVKRAEYFVKCAIDTDIAATISELIGMETIPIVRKRKKGDKTVDIRSGIVDITIAGDGSGFTMLLSLGDPSSPKPSEILSMIFNDGTSCDVTRVEQYTLSDGDMITPLELIW